MERPHSCSACKAMPPWPDGAENFSTVESCRSVVEFLVRPRSDWTYYTYYTRLEYNSEGYEITKGISKTHPKPEGWGPTVHWVESRLATGRLSWCVSVPQLHLPAMRQRTNWKIYLHIKFLATHIIVNIRIHWPVNSYLWRISWTQILISTTLILTPTLQTC